MLYTVISASGGVYNEWVYKVVGKSTSINLSNFQIYTFGIIFNAWGIVFTGGAFSIGQGYAPLRLPRDGDLFDAKCQIPILRELNLYVESLCHCVTLTRGSGSECSECIFIRARAELVTQSVFSIGIK